MAGALRKTMVYLGLAEDQPWSLRRRLRTRCTHYVDAVEDHAARAR